MVPDGASTGPGGPRPGFGRYPCHPIRTRNQEPGHNPGMGIRLRFLTCLLVVLLPLVAAALWTVRMVDQTLVERVEASLVDSLRLEAARILETLSRYGAHAEALAGGSWVRDSVGAVVEARAEVAERAVAEPRASAELSFAGRAPGVGAPPGLPLEASPDAGSDIAGDGFVTVDPRDDTPLDWLADRLREQAAASRSEIVQVRIVDAAGDTLGQSAGAGWTPADPDLLERALAAGRALFGDAWRTELDGGRIEERLGIVVPIANRDAAPVGALLLEARLAPVLDLVSRHETLGSTSEAHVVQPVGDDAAMLITPLRFDENAAFNKLVPMDSPLPVIQALRSPAVRVLRGRDYRGVDSILAVRTLEPTGWGLVAKIDAGEALRPLADVHDAARLTVFATLALLIGVWLFGLRPLGVRLQRTAAAAERVAEGQLQTPVGDGRRDEVGELARTIDRLATDLEADRSMRSAAESRLRYQATHDELTGLANRKRANALIDELGETPGRDAAVVFMDLDGFKSINDAHGHAVGDEVLIDVANRLEATLPPGATLARWGGDEFVAILPGCGEREAREVAHRLCDSLEPPVPTSAGAHRVGCSSGVASAGTGRALSAAIVEADTLMYEEKHRRRSEGTIDAFAARAVESALDEQRVELWVQPVVTVPAPGRVRLVGAEALVRLRSLDGGVISPDDFLSAVRKAPLGRALDRRVLERSIEGLARWRRAGVVDERFTLSVNVTGASLRDPSLAEELARILARHRVPPARIVIEISEKTGDFDIGVLEGLRATGVGIALDDVGLHRSNIDRLVSVNPEIAKIDRQWLADDVVLPRLIDLCRSLGFTLVAEGIETEAQLARLQGLQVTRFQGYLFDRPHQAVRFVERWGRHGGILETSNEAASERKGMPVVSGAAGGARRGKAAVVS